jgi:hypothetical protein
LAYGAIDKDSDAIDKDSDAIDVPWAGPLDSLEIILLRGSVPHMKEPILPTLRVEHLSRTICQGSWRTRTLLPD